MISDDGAYEGGFAITTHDTNFLAQTVRAIWVGTTGNIRVILKDGSDVTLSSVPVGLLRVRATRVMATGTTASNLVGLL
jgi:hypothetical protein